jgi:hypothetical protein
VPLKFAPPGSKRFRGLIRSQLTKAVEMINSINNYNTKLAARHPPTSFLTGDQVTALLNQRNLLISLLDQLN